MMRITIHNLVKPMHPSTPVFDISVLSVTERIDLALQLWESVHDQMQPVTLSSAQLAEIRRRSADIKSGRVVCQPFDQVIERLRRL